MEQRRFIPGYRCSAGKLAMVGQWTEVLPSKRQETSTGPADCEEPRAAKVHDIPTVATTYIYLSLAGDTTNVSLNQNHGAVPLTAPSLGQLCCKLFGAALGSYCEHFHSFG